MKRASLIAPLIALALFVSGAPLAHALATDADPGNGSDVYTGPSQTIGSTPTTITTNSTLNFATPSVSADGTVTNGAETSVPISSTATLPASTNQAAASTPTNNVSGSSINFLSDPLDYIMEMLMSLFAWLLGVAAITLDNSVYYTVVHMGSYVNNLSAVGVAWRILRDIGNIVLIFGFVALGITVILDVNWYGGGTKMLPVLVIAAIFLNFSLFAAEAVIDVGNLFATEFYTQINNGQPAAPQNYTGTNIANNGISLAVMNQLGLQTIYGAAINTQSSGTGSSAQINGGTSNANGIFQSGHPFILGFMAILIFMIAAFVFFSLAFILIARFIFLIFLIIVAPIGFAGLAVPKLDKTAQMWWSSLFEQTLTAPAMLLMLYVALAVITDSQFLTGFTVGGATGSAASNAAASSWTAWLTSNGTLAGSGISTTGVASSIGSLASVLLSFFVAMGLLLAVTMLAKKMGAIGGQWATNMGGKLTFGVAGFAARNTVGRTSNLIGRGIRKVAPNEFGRYASMAFDRGGKASFDFRATSALKTAQNEDQSKNAQKGGYLAEVDAKKKAQLAYGKTLDGGETDAHKDAEKAHATVKEEFDDAAKLHKKEAKTQATAEAAQKKAAQELAELEARVDPNNFDAILEDKIEKKRAEKLTADTELAAANTSLATAQTEKTAAETALKTAKDVLDKTPKNAQQQYGRSLQSTGNTFFTTATTGTIGVGSAAATGAVIGSALGPVGTVIGAGVGLAGAGAFRYFAPGTVKKSSASYQAGGELDRKAKMTKAEKLVADATEALKEETNAEKSSSKSEEKKEDAAAH